MRVLYFILFLSLSQIGFAQYQMHGRVIDSKNEMPVQYASVAILNTDSTLVTGSVTDSSGYFVIDDVNKGNYILQISFIGYEKYHSDPFEWKNRSNKEFGSIDLQLSGENLEEFTVSEEKSVVQNNIDKKVFNVEKNITTQGGTAVDVLENIPSVSVDMDGNINFRGSSGVRIHINGRPSGLLGSDPKAVLDQIPASQIESVEVITNPSAKYDPDGVSGIINIVLKKTKKVGVNAGVNLSWGVYDRLNGSASFNVRNDKINFFVNYGVNLYNGYRNFYQTREQEIADTTNTLNQERKGTHYWLNQNVTIGNDFYLGKNDQLGISANGYYNQEKRTGDMYYYQLGNDLDTIDVWNRVSEDPEKKLGGGFNLNYEHRFGEKKHKLTTEWSATYNEGSGQGLYDNYNILNGVQEDEPYYQQNTTTTDKNTLYLGRLDYSLPIKKTMMLETGVKAILQQQRRDFFSESQNTPGAAFQNDDELINDFQFSQDVYSFYGTWSHTIKQFSYQVGVRLEQAYMKSELFTTNESYNKNYFSFFPSAHLAYKIGDKNELKLSYSRRINRPNMWNTNPFPRYSDPYNIRMGNPNLDPEYINSAELGYGFYANKFTMTAAVYFRHTSDLIRRVRLVDAQGVSITTFRNIDDQYSYGLELVTMYKPWKWWRLNLSGNAFQINIVDSDPENDFNNSGFNYRLNFISTMTFWEDFEFQMSGYYRGPYTIPQGYLKPFLNLDIGLQKGILKGKGTIGIKVSDVFNTKAFNLVFIDNTFTQEATWKQETRFFYINFSYRFGKVDKNFKGGGSAPSGMD